jgi:hypothetical protein
VGGAQCTGDCAIVVGHSIMNDFRVLRLQHPAHLVRDTTRSYGHRKLQKLALEVLGRRIQQFVHEAGEDARAALDLYKVCTK